MLADHERVQRSRDTNANRVISAIASKVSEDGDQFVKTNLKLIEGLRKTEQDSTSSAYKALQAQVLGSQYSAY